MKGAGCFNPVNCEVATDEYAAVTVSQTPYMKVTVDVLSPEETQSSEPAEDNPAPISGGDTSPEGNSVSNGAAQQTQEVETPTKPSAVIPWNKPSSQASAGLGEIIAGAFGPHPSSTKDVSANSPSDAVGGTQESAAGASPIVVAGSTISLAPTASAIVDSGAGAQQGAADTAPVITIGSQEITANSASQYIVEGQTLAAGSPAIVVSGSTYSLAPSASAIIINGETSSLVGSVAPTDVAPVLSIGGEPVTMNSASQYIVGSQTLAPGGAPIEVSGTTYSLAPSASAVVINGVTSALPANNAGQDTAAVSGGAPAITIGGQSVTANSASQYIVGSQTLAPGRSPIVISGTTYSLAPSASAIVVNGVTSVLQANNAGGATTVGSGGAPAITIGGRPITGNSASQYIVGSQTLAPGSSAIIISGTTYSLAPSASAIVVNGVTSLLPATNAANGVAPVITVGSQLFTASPVAGSAYVIGSQTLVPGAPAITVSGVEVSLAPSASNVVVDGTTVAFSAATGVAPVITIGSQLFTATPVSGSAYVVGSQTLRPGASAITVGGVEVSLAPSASNVVVGGTTEAFSAATAAVNGTGVSGDAFMGDARRMGIGLKGQMLGLGLGLLGLAVM